MATKFKKMVTLSQDALDELEALSANDTHKYNESSVVEALIHEAYGRRADHLKVIEPIKDGNKTIGWRASYNGHIVIETDGAGSKPQAEQALDQYVWEELKK